MRYKGVLSKIEGFLCLILDGEANEVWGKTLHGNGMGGSMVYFGGQGEGEAM